MSNLRPILYGRWSSSCTWRVRAALEFKGIDYEKRHVQLADQHTSSFLKLTPTARIPALVHGGQILTESVAIIEFLEDNYPLTKKLLGGDSYNRSLIRSLSQNIVAGIHPLQNIGVLTHLAKCGMDQSQWAKYFITTGFDALEKRLERSAGQFCVGDYVSMADVCLVPQVYNAVKKFNIDMSPYKLISRINDDLSQVPAFQRAHADVQPDTPTEVRNKAQAL